VADDDHVMSGGTRYYRAPELIARKGEMLDSCDIYSAGIFLFALASGGRLPHFEDEVRNGVNLY